MRLRTLALVVVFVMGAGPGVVAAGPSLPAGCVLLLSGVVCVYSTSQLPLDFDQLVDDIDAFLDPLLELTGADGVVIEAWGGEGGAGDNGGLLDFCDSGGRGPQGYARTARLVSDVSAALTDGNLYIYVGEKGADQSDLGGYGGAASLVLQQAITDIGSSDITDPNGEGVYVIAGGGGGAGGCSSLFSDGSDGGDGGVAVAVLNTTANAEAGSALVPCAGASNCDPSNTHNYGEGGNSNFAGMGGSQSAADSGAHGADGIGGKGGAFSDIGSSAAWNGATVSWDHGRGGAGGLDILLQESNELSGHGGGGFGGGGGGLTYLAEFDPVTGMGGGGGGSWARAASINDSTLLVIGQGNGPGDHGLVTLSFQTDDDFEADLGVTKNDGVTSAVPGQDSIVYTIVASNDGPSDATNVTVKDTFPSELTCSWTSVAADGATGNTNGSGDLDELLDMPADSSVTYTVTCSIDPAATGTLSNTVTIHDTISDPGPNPNSATDDNTVLTPMADVAIVKDDGVTSAVPGQDTIIYTIVVGSTGPSDDPAVSVMDTFPAALDCSWTSAVFFGAVAGNTSSSGNLNDTLSMRAGSTVFYTVTCSIDPAATGTLSNTATATASVTDPGPGPNSATDNNTVLTPEADLDLAKHTIDTLGDDPQLYDQFQYELIVTNNGPSTVPSGEVTDVLPEQLVFVDSECGMTAVGQTVTWDIGVLGPDESISCLLTVEMVNFAHVVLNTASVDSPVDDPSEDNNADSSEALGVMPIIPTVGLYGLLLLVAGFGGIGVWRLRRAR